MCGYVYQLPRTGRAIVLCGVWSLCHNSILSNADYIMQNRLLLSLDEHYPFCVEGDRAVGKFSPLVRTWPEGRIRSCQIAIVALYCALFVLCALTIPMGNMVFSFVENNYHDNEKIFMAKYYCVRLHAMFGVALAAGMVAARKFGNYAPRPIFL
ncbi:2-carboxy-1 4-naphthoquinone phytyltransferase chloroplastic [Bienertia sinuspersici]